MYTQLEASLTVLPTTTAAQATPMPCGTAESMSNATTPMRTICSKICAREFGPTLRRAIKKPRRHAETAMNGRLGARIRSESAARASSSHQSAASPAPANSSTAAATPSPSPSPSVRRMAVRTLAGSFVASSSAERRVAATESPAVARVTAIV